MVQIKALSVELQKVANDELFEVPSRIPKDLETLKLWIEQQPHLQSRTDDQFLVQFLRGSKYSLEKVKERLDLYYTMKTKYPELFSVTDVENPRFRKILRLGCLTVLPRPLNDCGPRIWMFRFNYNCNEYKFEEFFHIFTALSELCLLDDPYSCIFGVILILDFNGATAKHYAEISPGLLKKNFTFFAKALPARIKGMYSINSSMAARQILKIALPFIPEKVKQRICVFGSDLEDLMQLVPRPYLPQDYGGENGLLEDLALDSERRLLEFRDYFKANEAYGTDETLRLGKPLDFDSMFGMGGSFRKLEVD